RPQSGLSECASLYPNLSGLSSVKCKYLNHNSIFQQPETARGYDPHRLCANATLVRGAPAMAILRRSGEQALFFQALVHIRDELAVAVPHQGRTPLIGAEDALRRLAPARMRYLRVHIG